MCKNKNILSKGKYYHLTVRTDLCTVLGIEFPIIQAAIAPYTSPELVAAVSNAGALGMYRKCSSLYR